jgi:predicted cobalt transporter CbtA
MALGANIVPDALIRQFEVASLVASGVFWLTLGSVAGFLDAVQAGESRSNG